MYKKYLQSIITHIPEAFIFIVFALIQASHINVDFWNDEIYTIQHFIFTTLGNTISDYHVPNNHIFFNLINNLYLKIIGISSLHDLFDNPWKLRIIPLIYSFITAYYIYKIGCKYINRTIGLLTLVLFITSLSFYNFSLQIRGYGLSIMLGVLIVYYILNYLNNLNKREIVIVAFLSFFLFYTIPSNLYFLTSIIAALGFYIIIDKRNIGDLFYNKYSYLIYAIISGILFTVFLYISIISDVFSNEYVRPGNYLILSRLKIKLLNIGNGLVYNRWVVISLFISASYIGYKSLINKNIILLLSTSVIIIPFLLNWVSGQNAPARIFTLCLPFTSLIIASVIYIVWKKITLHNRKKDWIIVSSIFLIAIFSLIYQLDKVEKIIASDIEKGNRSQDTYYQYYSARYWPLKNVSFLNSIYINNKKPIVVVGCEPHGITYYLEKYNLPYYNENNLDSLLIQNNDIYVVTNHPFQFDKRNDLNVEILNSRLSYHNILVIQLNQNLIK